MLLQNGNFFIKDFIGVGGRVGRCVQNNQSFFVVLSCFKKQKIIEDDGTFINVLYN